MRDHKDRKEENAKISISKDIRYRDSIKNQDKEAKSARRWFDRAVTDYGSVNKCK